MAVSTNTVNRVAVSDNTTVVDEATAQRVYDQRVPTWPLRFASLVIGYLWFTQTLWKLPWNNFGNVGERANGLVVNTNLTAQQPGPFVDSGGGLYHWMVQEAIYGNKVVPGYGDLIKNLVLPNWQVVGWLTFLLEAAIALLLIFGLFSRLGGFLSLLQAANLYIGLSQHPQEWPWTYGMLLTLGFIFMLTGAGRVLGLDQLLRPRLRRAKANGNRVASLLYWLT